MADKSQHELAQELAALARQADKVMGEVRHKIEELEQMKVPLDLSWSLTPIFLFR